MYLDFLAEGEVIEDLLDIKIFSSMNTIIKDKIRQTRESIKVLNLKKENQSLGFVTGLKF